MKRIAFLALIVSLFWPPVAKHSIAPTRTFA